MENQLSVYETDSYLIDSTRHALCAATYPELPKINIKKIIQSSFFEQLLQLSY